MNSLSLRHQVFQLLVAQAQKASSGIADVTLSNPTTGAGPWSVVVTTTDGRTLNATFTED